LNFVIVMALALLAWRFFVRAGAGRHRVHYRVKVQIQVGGILRCGGNSVNLLPLAESI
jgi:hypothetical protein